MPLNPKRKRGDINNQHAKRVRVGANVEHAAQSSRQVAGPTNRHANDPEPDAESENEIQGDETKSGEVIDQLATPGSGPNIRKLPTAVEVKAIKDAGDLYLSRAFKLQIDALLPNVRPLPKRIPPFESFLSTLHQFLITLEPIAPLHPLKAQKHLPPGVSIPYVAPLPVQDTKWTVSFTPPKKGDILLVGSWPNGTCVKRKDVEAPDAAFGVDMGVMMDIGLFQEKDYLNGRYFQKRAFYLAAIAAAVVSSKDDLNVEVQYESPGGDPRSTVLVIVPAKNRAKNDISKLGACVRILPMLSTSSPIPLQKLSPGHGNLHILPSTTNSASSHVVNQPTPLYNTALLLALTPKGHLLSTHALMNSAPAFKDALTLLRVWANQRGYGQGKRACVRGFDGKGHLWAELIRFLIMGGAEMGESMHETLRRPLGNGLSSYQLFRSALDFLSRQDWAKTRLYAKSADKRVVRVLSVLRLPVTPLKRWEQFPPEEYAAHHEAVFVDSLSLVNLLADIPLGSLELIRFDASKTLEALRNEERIHGDPFSTTFLMEQRDLPTRFDTLLRVDISGARPKALSVHEIHDHGSTANALLSSLSRLLQEALGDRSKAVAILHPTTERRSLSQGHPASPTIIYIGLLHDAENALRLVDHGPSADQADSRLAKRFTYLWGDKAELRRFKDGRINLSVVWDVNTSDDRAQVPSMIIQHVLARHFGIGSKAIRTWQTSFDSVLRLPDPVTKLYRLSGVSTGFKAAIAAFDELAKNIRSLVEELPLPITNVSAASEYLRYTSIFAPIPMPPSVAASLPPGARYQAPMEIILQPERSTRWPDDLEAIQKIKLAFYERLADGLMKLVPGTRAVVVSKDALGRLKTYDESHLDIFTSSGWAFSARIWHDRELTLLMRVIETRTREPGRLPERATGRNIRNFQEAREARDIHVRRFIHASGHHSAVATMCHRYAAYSGTVRLVKRWLGSHWLLSGHVCEEAVEILCASVFVQNRGSKVVAHEDYFSIPRSKERGFCSVIQVLRNWNWNDPLFVPLYEQDGSPLSGVLVPGSSTGAWALSTAVDISGHVWTGPNLDDTIACRVQALAKATWKTLGQVEGGSDIQTIFAHPQSDYDLVFNLNPALLPRYAQNVQVDLDVLSKEPNSYNQISSMPGFDPALMLYKDLKQIYAGTLRFFYDESGGDVFGAVWEPHKANSKPLMFLSGYSTLPHKEKHKNKQLLSLNKDAVLEEIRRLGSGLV